MNLHSCLGEVIGPELIARAERLGACSEALEWLRKEPRTWHDLRGRNSDWICWGTAQGLADSVLPEMMLDPDATVRCAVAERIDVAHLPEMMRDPDVDVRCAVAERIDPSRLPEMVADPDAIVRQIVAQRLGTFHNVETAEGGGS